ncbi:recombinase family protein [Frateuria edaphi]|uniref:recombinase family protein n=1 Tax=Frateuria edaphi TaxID=2898793 RepID=UPI001E4BBEB8|nr:recombinase family protein [Frateuria edaphi]UGB46595.1 recombinase family protein [Frateuria edaphi]
MSEIVGYCRVSSTSQSLAVQLGELELAGCTKVFAEKRSARYSDNRPELKACLEYVREGDTLVISRLDRMARSVLDLASIADRLHRKGVNLKVINQGIDTSTSEGKLLFGILSTFAAFELDIRSERQKAGIEAAMSAGVKFGRKKSLTDEQKLTIRRLREQEGFSIAQLQTRFHVSRATVYRALTD